MRSQYRFGHWRLGMLVLLLVSPACADEIQKEVATQFDVNVFYPGGAGIDSMLQASVSSVASPDFEYHYKPVDIATWGDTAGLSQYLVSIQQSSPADGFFLACKNTELEKIGELFRSTFPTVPFVDTFAPALLAANIVSYRYAVLTGTENGELMVKRLISELGMENHLRLGGTSVFRDDFMVTVSPYTLTTGKNVSIQDIIPLGSAATGSHHTDLLVLNIEAIVLAGCEGFLDVGVASDAQSQLAQESPPVPIQVINPIKASIGLLHSMIRNKVWVSVPRPYQPGGE